MQNVENAACTTNMAFFPWTIPLLLISSTTRWHHSWPPCYCSSSPWLLTVHTSLTLHGMLLARVTLFQLLLRITVFLTRVLFAISETGQAQSYSSICGGGEKHSCNSGRGRGRCDLRFGVWYGPSSSQSVNGPSSSHPFGSMFVAQTPDYLNLYC